MKSTFQMKLLRVSRRPWVRSTLYSVLGVATALVASWIGPYLPEGLETKIGADAVDSILNIIATSMLTVSTFSLSTMVAAFGSATSSVTPRATRLLIEDTTTHKVLATFIGAFLYSLVGIIALTMDFYGDEGRVVLFVVTIGVVILIVVTLLRWIDHLTRLGRVNETTAEVERVTARAIRERARIPYLGGKRLTRTLEEVQAGGFPVLVDRIGYVRLIDMERLDAAAKEQGLTITVLALPGTFNAGVDPVAVADRPIGDLAPLIAAFDIGDERSYDGDPRFGLCVLSEIAQRALSPGINDPGTAIDVIGRTVRLLALWSAKPEQDEPRYPRIAVGAITMDDCFDDAFLAIGRDGEETVEIGLRLLKALEMLTRRDQELFGKAARRHGAMVRSRSLAALQLEADRNRIKEAAYWLEA